MKELYNKLQEMYPSKNMDEIIELTKIAQQYWLLGEIYTYADCKKILKCKN